MKLEPLIALDGGESFLQLIQVIIAQAPPYLAEGGRLYLEIGETQTQSVLAMAQEHDAFHAVEILKDSAGKDRFLRAVRAYMRI